MITYNGTAAHYIYPAGVYWACVCGESWPGDAAPRCPRGRLNQPQAHQHAPPEEGGAPRDSETGPPNETGYWPAVNSIAPVWGEARNCRQCARQEPHSYRSHEQSVHASRVARMED